MMQTLLIVLLLANALWFGAAFRLFWLKAFGATRLLVKSNDKQSEAYAIMAAALPFLGGMNLALSLLAVLAVVLLEHFSDPAQVFALTLAFGVAHLSQFFGNLPVARQERATGDSLWPVLRGPMLFIFVVDLGLGLINLAVALAALFQLIA